MSGMVNVAAPDVCAARIRVTVCDAASAAIIFSAPEVFPLARKYPVFVEPEAMSMCGVVASEATTVFGVIACCSASALPKGIEINASCA